jgi:putative MATE family efflux protein
MNKRPNLTEGSIPKIVISLAVPHSIALIMRTLYYVTDLFFVGRLSSDAVAALSICGNTLNVVLGLSFTLGIGSLVLIAQSFGKKDYNKANLIFKQSLLLGAFCGMILALAGFLIARPFVLYFGGQGDTLTWGIQYFRVNAFCMMTNLILFVIGSSYRGMGDTKTPMYIMVQSTIINIVLDPILIFGIGFPAMGVQGAAIASLISQVYGLARYAYLIIIKGSHLSLKGSWRPDFPIIGKSLLIGIPAGLTSYVLALNTMIIFKVISIYGTAAIASVGIGMRVLQTVFLPIAGVTAVLSSVVGQNYGAKIYSRIMEAFRFGLKTATIYMICATCICWIFRHELVAFFDESPDVIVYGGVYLSIMALSNIGVGISMTVSSVLLGLGKTTPSFVSVAINTALFSLCVFTLPGYFGWGIESIWWINVITGLGGLGVLSVWFNNHIKLVRQTLL